MRAVVSGSLVAVLLALAGGAGRAQNMPNPPPFLEPAPVETPPDNDPAGDPPGDAPPRPGEDAPLEPRLVPGPEPTTSIDGARDLRVRLVYSPGPWANVCPPLDDVRGSIEEHLGYDPFGEPAERVVLMLLDTTSGTDDGAPDRARVELLDQDLKSLGTRSVTSSEGCVELVATAALQVSIAVDPARIAGPSSTPRPTTPPPTTEGELESTDTGLGPVPPAAVPLPPEPMIIEHVAAPPGFFGLNAHVSALLTPQPFNFGGTVFAGFRWEWLSSRLEFRMDFPGDENGTTSVPLLLAMVPCLHLPIGVTGPDERVEVSGCATLTGGVIPSVGDFTGVGIYAGAGGRVGLDYRFEDSSVIRGFLQLEGAAARPRYTSSTGNDYTAPAVNAVVGVGVDLPSLN